MGFRLWPYGRYFGLGGIGPTATVPSFFSPLGGPVIDAEQTKSESVFRQLHCTATAKISVRAKSGDAREVSIDKTKIDYYQLQLDMATAK